jgi:pyroglutamyl-peptidase
MIRVLLTSFEPFGGHGLNSSLEVGRALARRPPPGVALEWVVLPVVAWECVAKAWEAVEHSDPAVVLSLGQAAGAAGVRLEDRAININHFPIPDNAGNLLRDGWIIPCAPSVYRTTTDLHAICDELLRARVPVERSWHAGTYVCNHLFYGLLHRAAESGRGHQTGFFHLPLLPEQVPAGQRWPACALERMVEGVRRAIEVCAAAHRAAGVPQVSA